MGQLAGLGVGLGLHPSWWGRCWCLCVGRRPTVLRTGWGHGGGGQAVHTPHDFVEQRGAGRDEVNVEFRLACAELRLSLLELGKLVLVPWGLQPGVGQGDGGTLSWSEGRQESAQALRAELELSQGPAFKEQTQSCFNQKNFQILPLFLMYCLGFLCIIWHCSEWGGGQGSPRGGAEQGLGLHSTVRAVAGPQPRSGISPHQTRFAGGGVWKEASSESTV